MTDELKKAQEDFIAKNFEDGLAVGAFKSYEQSPIFLAMKEALEYIRIHLSGSNHTMLPMNVRELDGSISQVRRPSNEGLAYAKAGETLRAIEGDGE